MRSVVVAAVVLGIFLGAGCQPSAPPEHAASLAVPPMPNADGLAPAPAAEKPAPRCIKALTEPPPPIPAPASAKRCPPAPGPLPLAHGDLTFEDASPAMKIDVEIADTPTSIERGLMYRRVMSDGSGMFFKLDERRDHTFWMHNTCMPLDMMFVDTDGLIVGIVEGAAPLTDSIRSVGCKSAYVLEVNGGWTRLHNVKPGQRITIPI